MRVTRIGLTQFRGFSSASIDIDRQLTVLVGENGSGKSSVLDAISLMLSRYTSRLTGSKANYKSLSESDVRQGAAKETRVKIRVDDERFGAAQWTLTKQGPRERLLKPSRQDLSALGALTRQIAEVQSEGPEFLRGETLPVYFDQTRTILKDPIRRRRFPTERPIDVFKTSASSWNIDLPKLVFWFEDRESEELRRQKTNPRYVDRELESVRRAMVTATGLRSPYFSVESPRGLRLRKGQLDLPLSYLSTGERVFITLAADLARRLACTTDYDVDPLLGSAIVLIDEVELHLHPKWQRKFVPWLLRTFPNCQFIISTHSPQVLTEVPARHVRVLTSARGTTRVSHPTSTFGRDANHLLRSIFDLDERRSPTLLQMHRADSAISSGDYDEARRLIDALETSVEGGAPEVAILRARLDRRISQR